MNRNIYASRVKWDRPTQTFLKPKVDLCTSHPRSLSPHVSFTAKGCRKSPLIQMLIPWTSKIT